MAAPSGVVTFLFTDVEGSTRRWESDAEAMKVALAAHDDVLRAAIETHGGWLFKHTGDGVVAAFASPRSAVDAAITAQRTLELPVRMGLATGEADLRGGDYFGAVLNRAARVMAAGHGGQILLAESTAVLLNAIDLLDLGPRRLRDLPAAVGIFQVRTPGLRTDFPPLRTLDTAPGNLRPAPSSFIGRESELDAVATELKSHRLVTLTGVGGVGKTRLATEVATRLADEFPDGVWLFELAPVGDPGAVPDAVAAILGITQPTRQKRKRVGGHRARRQNPAAGHRQLRTRARHGGRSDRRNPHALGDREDPGHQPRRARHSRRTAVAGADLLDALVRKSLLVADRSTGQTRFSMLETIRQFAEEQLALGGGGDQARAAHAAYFADCATDMLALWDGPRQREAYTWFTTEFANLRTAFRWSAANGDLDSAATLATHATSLGVWLEQYEPVAWAEELIEPARAANHRRLLQLYVEAAQCYAAGRTDDAFDYLEASQKLTGSADFDPDLHESQTSSGIAYAAAGRPQRWAEVCREAIARGPGPRTITRACLVMAFHFLADVDGAKAASEGLLAEAAATTNPTTACFAFFAHGMAYRHSDPAVFYHSARRALAIAQGCGNRQMEAAIAVMLSMLATTRDDPSDSLNYIGLAIRHYLDAGSVSLMHNPLAILVGVFDRLGHHEQAATISGFAASPMARAGYPQFEATITHLRETLGDKAYESFAHASEAMTIAAVANYALAHIEQTQAT